jgi:hypothetical protein
MQKECQWAFAPGKTGGFQDVLPPQPAIGLEVTAAGSFFEHSSAAQHPVTPIVETGGIDEKDMHFDPQPDYDGPPGVAPWRSMSEAIKQSPLILFEIAPLSREAAAARSCGRKPAESETKIIASREAATAIGRAEISAAASRLRSLSCLVPVGLCPRLHAAIASRFRKCATSILTFRVMA